MKALLALENGLVLEGNSIGAEGTSTGEIVFNTSMTGYQEIFSDPSYFRQIIIMTSTQIGNYGCNLEDFESNGFKIAGLVAREISKSFSNWRSQKSLIQLLKENGIIAIEGVDTRMLTRAIREKGAMKAALSTEHISPDDLIRAARNWRGMVGYDIASEVSSKEMRRQVTTASESRFKVVAFDFGIKENIIRMLNYRGCDVLVVPADTISKEVLGFDPDGIVLSNGPGDPAAVSYAIKSIEKLLGKAPIFGICLGHQLLALAMGAKTYKLKFGHRGSNHPVKNLKTGAIEITAQNHGFAVDEATCDGSEISITHINLNDMTVEGIESKNHSAFAIQYHPEASPGPHDSGYLFDRFIENMESFRDTSSVNKKEGLLK